jgi:Flp pilus assembly protein TadG
MKLSNRRRHLARKRRGTIIVLSAFVLTMLLIVGAVSINLTQLSTARTEIRLASDAAAKAGAVILGQTQNVDQARAAARHVAAQHEVAGMSMQIQDIDVQFGHTEKDNSGNYSFVENQSPLNSVRVNTRIGGDALTQEGSFFMGDFLQPASFSLNYTSTASRVDHDLCLVVDRSGSMSWDMSNTPWKYPEDTSSTSTGIIQNYFVKPHPTLSRWSALVRSTDVFFEALEELPTDVKVGLVSYSSNFVFGLYESTASTTHNNLTLNHDDLIDSLNDVGSKELIGNTNIASGMQAAVNVLTGQGSRITAKGTMIVLTDGIWNQGTDPMEVAAAAAAANITVHTITFSDQADIETMAAVAAVGGGRHYHAPDESTLQSVFSEIAKTLPAVLTN